MPDRNSKCQCSCLYLVDCYLTASYKVTSGVFIAELYNPCWVNSKPAVIGHAGFARYDKHQNKFLKTRTRMTHIMNSKFPGTHYTTTVCTRVWRTGHHLAPRTGHTAPGSFQHKVYRIAKGYVQGCQKAFNTGDRDPEKVCQLGD